MRVPSSLFLLLILVWLLSGCYDRDANGNLVEGSSISLYTLDEQQTPFVTTSPIIHENPLLNGLVIFVPLPEGYSAQDGYYLVEACGGEAAGVPLDGCRYILVDSKYFFDPKQSEGWGDFSGLWNMSSATDAIARAVKDTYSHQTEAEIRAAINATATAAFGEVDSNGDGIVSYDDLAFSPTTDYAQGLSAVQLNQLHEQAVIDLVLQADELDVGDGNEGGYGY